MADHHSPPRDHEMEEDEDESPTDIKSLWLLLKKRDKKRDEKIDK